MWAALAPVAAALISGSASYMGGQQANAANAGQSAMQIANSWNQMQAQQAYSREQFDWQKDFARDQYQFELDNNRLNSAVDAQRAYEGQMRTFDYGREMQGSAQNFALEQQMRQQSFERQNMNTAMNYNWQAADAQRQFTDFMARTSYQRAMGDMKLAGLNPLLAYSQGGAAVGSSGQASIGAPGGSAPTAGMASAGGFSPGSTSPAHAGTPHGGSVSAPGYQRAVIENTIGPAVASAMQGAKFLTELEAIAANINRTNADTRVLNEQAHQVQANTALQVAQHASEGKRTELIGAQVASEQRRPGQIAAATEAAESSAVASRAAAGASTSQAGLSGAQTRQTELQTQQYERYGPPGVWSGLAGTGEAVARRGLGALQSGEPILPGGGSVAGAAVGAIREWANGAGGWIRRQLQSAPDDGTADRLRRAHQTVR